MRDVPGVTVRRKDFVHRLLVSETMRNPSAAEERKMIIFTIDCTLFMPYHQVASDGFATEIKYAYLMPNEW